MRHGHGRGGQRLLPRGLRLLQGAGARQDGLRDLESRVRMGRGLCLKGNLRLR